MPEIFLSACSTFNVYVLLPRLTRLAVFFGTKLHFSFIMQIEGFLFVCSEFLFKDSRDHVRCDENVGVGGKTNGLVSTYKQSPTL